jgi:hypothetical protein
METVIHRGEPAVFVPPANKNTSGKSFRVEEQYAGKCVFPGCPIVRKTVSSKLEYRIAQASVLLPKPLSCMAYFTLYRGVKNLLTPARWRA